MPLLQLLLLLTPCTITSSAVLDSYVTLQAGHKLWYRVCRPSLLEDDTSLPPLLVCHGGPQVPSDYLWDLEDVSQNRSVILYDQLGCGRSDEPPAGSGCYSVEASVDDLRELIATLRLRRC